MVTPQVTRCTDCQARIPSLKARLNRVNGILADLGRRYHDYLPVFQIDTALIESGFEPLDATVSFLGCEGRTHEPVGEDKWISISWHRMDSGRWEVVAYVN